MGPEEGPGAEITRGCKWPNVVLGVELKFLGEQVLLTIDPSLQPYV